MNDKKNIDKKNEKEVRKHFKFQLSKYKNYLLKDGEIGLKFFLSDFALDASNSIRTQLNKSSLTEENRTEELNRILGKILDLTGYKTAGIYLSCTKKGNYTLGNGSYSYLERISHIGNANFESFINSNVVNNPFNFSFSNNKTFSLVSQSKSKHTLIHPLNYQVGNISKIIGVVYFSTDENIPIDYDRFVTIQSLLKGFTPTIVEKTIENRLDHVLGGRFFSEVPYLLKFKPAKLESLLKGSIENEVTSLFLNLSDQEYFKDGLKGISDLREYKTILSSIVKKYGGKLVDHHESGYKTGIFALFNPLGEIKDPRKKAISCAVELQEVSKSFFQEKYGSNGQVSIGINTGKPIVGNIASHEDIALSVLGHSVNVAARLASYGLKNNLEIIVSENSRVKTKGLISKSSGKISVKNIEEPIEIFSYSVKDSFIPPVSNEVVDSVVSKINLSSTTLRNYASRLRSKLDHLRQLSDDERLEYEKNQTKLNDFARNTSDELTRMLLDFSFGKHANDPFDPKKGKFYPIYQKLLENVCDLIGFGAGDICLIKSSEHETPNEGDFSNDENYFTISALYNAPERLESKLNQPAFTVKRIKSSITTNSFALNTKKPFQVCVNIDGLPEEQKKFLSYEYFRSRWNGFNKKIYKVDVSNEYYGSEEDFFNLINSNKEFIDHISSVVFPLVHEGEVFGLSHYDSIKNWDSFYALPQEKLDMGMNLLSNLINNILFIERQNRYQEKIKSSYPKRLIDLLIEDKDEFDLVLAGKRHEVTAISIDLVAYSKYSEGKDPKEIIRDLNNYYTIVDHVFKKYNIIISKHAGDGVEAIANFFGDEVNYVENSINAVIEIKNCLEGFNAQYGLNFKINAGIATGTDIVGNIGSTDRVELSSLLIPTIAHELEEIGEGGQLLIDSNTLEKINVKLNMEFVKVNNLIDIWMLKW